MVASERRWQAQILLLLLATAAAVPLLAPALATRPLQAAGIGFLSTRGGGDSPFLLFRLHQLVAALADGHFPPRWMPDAAYGLGYPFFSYYAALPFYAGALFHLMGFGLVAAVKMAQWSGMVLGAWAVWGLVSHFHDRRAGLLAAAAYTFAPYHLVNVYVRGDSLNEFWAMGLYPLILWTAARLWERPGRGRVLLFALSYAALALTHNISSLIFGPFLLLFLAILLLRPAAGRVRGGGAPSRRRRAAWVALGLALGLGLSAFYWVPALGEQDAVQLSAQTTGYFHYSNHYRTLVAPTGGSQGLIQSALVFDYRIEGRTPFGMGAVQAILTTAGVVAALLRWRRSRASGSAALVLFALLALLISTLMITPASGFLWDNLPLLPLVQFPWRFLSVQSLAAAILIAMLASRPSAGARVSQSLVPLALALLIAFAALAGLRTDAIALAGDDVTSERLQLYEWFSGNVGTSVRYEYLPRAVVPRLYTSEAIVHGASMEARVLAGEASSTRLTKRTGRESWRVDVHSNAATVAFPTLYWPGWRAWVDGEPSAARPAESLGTIALDLPAGEHVVSLALGRTPLRLASELVSLATLLGSVVWLAAGAWRGPILPGVTRGAARGALWLLLPVAVVAGVLRLIPSPHSSVDDLTWDFSQQAYLHHNPAGVRFGSAAVMESYRYVERGDEGWEVVVQWTELARLDLTAELALVYPAEVVHGVPYTLVTTRQVLAGSETRVFLSLPGSAPPGPVLVRLRVLDPEGRSIPALTSSGNQCGDLYLRPVWAGSTSPFGREGGAELLGAQAEYLDWETMAVVLRWGVGEAIHANYKLALRLRDAAGNEWGALDAQPGYGFYPTSLWRPGTAFSERFALSVPYGLPPGDYALSVSLYDAATLAAVWGPQEQQVTLEAAAPYDGRPLLHRFTTALGVASVSALDAIYQGDPLPVTMGWVALEEADAALSLNWELVGNDGSIAGSGAGELAPGSDPAAWPAGSLVLGRYRLATDPTARPGDYTLRLALPEGEVWEASTVTIQARSRRFELPDMQTRLGVEFGGLIRLEGADLVQGADVLDLTLYWRALEGARIPADYSVFVHLFDPATEHIAAQSDAMPRASDGPGYPTSRWAPGEVVEDPITLSLANVPPGTYRLGIGLYRREGDRYPRLPAVDPAGDPVPADRVVLPAEIAVP